MPNHSCSHLLTIREIPLQVELKAARNLVSANLNGTSDPYALLCCGDQKRFRWVR